MKKSLLLLFAAFATLLSSAQTEIEGIWYYLNESTQQAEVTHKFNEYGSYSGSITIPATVTHEGVEYNVTSIGKEAFSNCSSLTSITIPEGVTSIGEYAFSNCSSLTSITIPESSQLTSIGECAFSGCSSFTSIAIPESVTSIGYDAFYGCCSLTSITIPDGVTEIGSCAFCGCRNLTSISIPASVTSIGYDAFAYCKFVFENFINKSICSDNNNWGAMLCEKEIDGILIDNNIVVGCRPPITIAAIPEGVTNIGDGAFSGCSSLTSITIPEGVTSIGESAFSDCSSLAAVHISSLEAWCKISFDWNSNPLSYAKNLYLNGELVTELVIPEGVTSIGVYAFSDCCSLTSITLPTSVTSIGYEAFHNCSSLNTIVVAEGNEVFDSRNGCNAIIETSESTLILGCSSTIIPEGVTGIGGGAFYGCSGLTSITIPASVTSIGTWIFYNCTGLTSITCYAATPPSCEHEAFDGIYKQVPVYVPATSMSKYWYADGWKEFTNYQPLVVVTNITLSLSTTSLIVGEELVLTAEVAPDNAPNPTLAWSSSDPSVASVDITGKVVALAPGTVIVTAIANDGSGVSASCEVIVRPAPAERCTAPVISYVGGKVVLTCTTEGAKVITTVTEDNDNTFEVLSFDYIPTHTFTAYATKENYANSEVVTLTLCWIPCAEDHEEDNGIINIPSRPMLISTQGGIITLTGLTDGTKVAIYDTAGQQLGTATASNGAATITTNLTVGTTAIVKIGGNSIKVVIK